MNSRRPNWSQPLEETNATRVPTMNDLEKRFNIYGTSAAPQESTRPETDDLESRFKIYTPKKTVPLNLGDENELENRYKMHSPEYDRNEEFNSRQQYSHSPEIYQIHQNVAIRNYEPGNDFNENLNAGQQSFYAPELQMQYHPEVTTSIDSRYLSDPGKKENFYEETGINPSPENEFSKIQYEKIRRRNIPTVDTAYPDRTFNMTHSKQKEPRLDDLRELTEPLFKKRQINAEFEVKSSGKTQKKRRNNITRAVVSIKSVYQNFALFKNTLKKVEIKYGTSASVYFLFIQWLMFLNLLIFVLLLVFIILPSLLHVEENVSTCSPDNTTSSCCALNYFNKTEDFYFLDIFQGTGILERTHVFYGKYSDKSIDYMGNSNDKQYKLSVAYLGITVCYFLFSLILIIRGSTKSFKENITDVNKSQFGNMIFGSWKFSIDNEKDVMEKKKTIFHEITTTLQNKIAEEERARYMEEHITRIRIIRVLTNFLVIVLLVGAAVAIYFVFNFSMDTLDDESLFTSDSFSEFLKILLQFLPSITIVFLNLVIPLIFEVLIGFENYSPSFSITFTLMRMVFLRMFSLCVFYASLHGKILCKVSDNECNAPNCPTCWETYAGQQIYKLAITDFIINIATTFFIGGLRVLGSKMTSFISKPMFDLPKHTLDIIYLQTICWVGTFYVPFLPAIFVIIFFVMFHVKVLVCFKMSQPAVSSYNTSRSNAMFMIVLLVGLIFALLPIVYSIGILQPSKSCGPFRDHTVAWDAVSKSLSDAPNWLSAIIYFIGTEGFAIPIIILLCLIIYYYAAVLATNQRIIQDLKDQLSQDNGKQILRQMILTHEKSQ